MSEVPSVSLVDVEAARAMLTGIAIETPLEEYAEVRGHAKLFLVKPGHADEEVERVVSDEGDYEVVEKAVTPPAF